MAKDNLSVSLGLIGMNKSTHPHLLDEKSYTHARNANLDTDLEGMALTNEHSNILCNKLFGSNGKEQVVVGYKYDGLNQRMILFLTDKEAHLNPLYDSNTDVCGVKEYVRQSQIGYIPVTTNVDDETDLELDCGCDIVSMLSKPLEDFEEYIETCKYTQIITDCAENNYCLNLDPNYPVKDIVLKQEACGTTMTFASKNNPPRYINLDRIEDYKYKGRKTDCDIPEPTCLDCDKLRLFPEFEPMNIVPHMMMYGGNLRMGKYEFFVAYCDRSGRELTEYVSATNHVHIFDIRNRRRDATQLHDKTTSGIHIKIKDIDDRFNYLKVVVGEITGDNKDASYYVVGVYPISVTDVYYTTNALDTSETKNRITSETIVSEKPVYKYFGGLTTSNGYLYGYDYEVEKEINLQKIASLMGSFLKWRTLEAGEDLYQDGVNNALYRGYFRDEVYPFGIRFRLKNGFKTRVFHLVSRPPLSTDLLPVPNNTDVLSVMENSGDCFGSVRDKYWQFYNTAEELGLVTDFVGRGEVKIVETTVNNDCINPEAIILENGSIEMNISEDYRGLRDWINRYSEEIVNTTDPDSQFYSQDLKQILMTPASAMCNMEEIYGAPICEDGSCSDKYCDPQSPFYNESICLELSNLCDDSGKCHSVCETPEPVADSGKLSLEELKEKSTVKVEKKLPSESGDAPDYKHGEPPADCNQFSLTAASAAETRSQRPKLQINLTGISHDFGDGEEEFTLNMEYPQLYERVEIMSNHDCSEAYSVGRLCNYFIPFQSTVVHTFFVERLLGGSSAQVRYLTGPDGVSKKVAVDYNPELGEELMYSNKNAVRGGGFKDKLGRGALWYYAEFADGEDEIILEITPGSKGEQHPDMLNTSSVRLTTYTNCKDTDYVHSEIYDIKDGYWLRLKKSDYGGKNKVYIALDTEVVKVTAVAEGELKEGLIHKSHVVGYVNKCPNRSFSVLKRDKEYYKQVVEYEKLRFSYSETYTAQCRYLKSTSNNPDCEPVGHKEGMFSYWESTVNYPENCDLFDSSGLTIDVDRLSEIATGSNQKLFRNFKEYYIDQGVTNSNANLTNKPIRHFKFPDNKVAPFINTEDKLKFDSSMIYPMGVTIDDDIVNFFLDEAVKNKLIDSCTRDSIISYEIFSGERGVKSVISRGLLHDMYKASDELTGGNVYFRNFPYNTLGKNTYLTKTMDSRELIEHPFESTSNNRFSFVSPEVYTDSGGFQATEMTIDGYQYGESDTTWVDVEEHSKWVILGEKAKRQANTFAWLEAAFEYASILSMMVIEASKNGWVIIGQSNGNNAKGAGKAIWQIAAFSAVQGANIFIFKRPQFEMQWLSIAEDNGPVVNHAEYSVSGRGHYNRFKPNDVDNSKLRGIQKLMFLNNGREATMEDTGLPTYITNIDRENSVYLYLGSGYNVEYPAKYVKWDNYDVSPRKSSRVTVGDLRLCHVKRPTHTGNIASPYVTLKRYVPDQYGTIDSIQWVHTGHIKKFSNQGSHTFFGGDAYITRVDFKNKYRIFHTDAVEVANRTPFNYKDQTVIGGPKYYANYKTETKLGNVLKTEYFADTVANNLDCFSGKEFYIRDWERFYLYVYGTPYFMVESTINGEYRYSGKEPYEQFASQGIDMIWHTQEVNVPIHSPVRFNYDAIYSTRRILGLVGTSLDSLFDQKLSDCWAESKNGVAWSDMDNSEVSYNDPWLVFRPGNIYRFPFSFGRLIGLDNIESNVVVGRFTNNATLFNSVDQLRDRVTANNENIGTGGIFASGRPVQFSYTQLGETGSQHRDFISTEFGHFFVDARRGKVLKLATNGQGLEAISDLKGNEESGMRRWFKKHLPFKILKSEISGLTEDDLDNKYKGLGISLGWDSRFKRLFVTKLDYMVRRKYRGKISYAGGNFYLTESNTEISLQDETYFKNVSWTIAYSAIYNCWVSFYDFKPDLYFSYDNYFQTVINYAGEYHKNRGIWSHLLTNKSYQVYYGDYYPFEIETIIKNTNTQNVLKDLKVWTFSHRYHDNFDYAQWRKKSFNKLVIHNQTNNSGLLHLNYDDSIHAHKFPRPVSRTEQEIKATHFEEQLSINYFYNRVRSEESGLPIWKSDENNIHYVLNPDVISFDSKKVLERLRGDWFKVLLIQDNTSQFKQVFKWQMNREQSYQ